MAEIMTGQELAAKALEVANLKTAYIFGGIGERVTEQKLRVKGDIYAKNATHVEKARPLIGQDAYMFDCVCLIKALLWGWTKAGADAGKIPYCTNRVPDINADAMILRCSGISADFSNIAVGEALWMQGHIGIYIGNGLGVECTPAFKRGVQVTAVGNIGKQAGYSTRTWSKHGKLPWIEYILEDEKIRVIFNGRPVDISGRFEDGTNYVSGTVREVFGALGATVTADGKTPIITLEG